MSLTVHFDVLYIFLLNRSHSITSIMHFHYKKKINLFILFFIQFQHAYIKNSYRSFSIGTTTKIIYGVTIYGVTF